MSGKMTIERLDLGEANAFVREYHRHHKPVIGHLFSIGAALDGVIVGVAIVGRPVARGRDDGVTAEITRLATDGTRNACSFLWRICQGGLRSRLQAHRNLHFGDRAWDIAFGGWVEADCGGSRSLLVVSIASARR
jgi:hypothetical protein